MATPKQTDPQFKLRLTPDLKQSIEEAATVNNRSMNAEIIARLEQSFQGSSFISDSQARAFKAFVETLEWRQAKAEIDIGSSIAALKEMIKLLKQMHDSPKEHQAQAVVAARRLIESAATHLGRPYGYAQMKTSRFVADEAPDHPLQEVIETAEWVVSKLLHEYRRLKEENSVGPQA